MKRIYKVSVTQIFTKEIEVVFEKGLFTENGNESKLLELIKEKTLNFSQEERKGEVLIEVKKNVSVLEELEKMITRQHLICDKENSEFIDLEFLFFLEERYKRLQYV
jgi:broad-specificity NMP kinase